MRAGGLRGKERFCNRPEARGPRSLSRLTPDRKSSHLPRGPTGHGDPGGRTWEQAASQEQHSAGFRGQALLERRGVASAPLIPAGRASPGARIPLVSESFPLGTKPRFPHCLSGPRGVALPPKGHVLMPSSLLPVLQPHPQLMPPRGLPLLPLHSCSSRVFPESLLQGTFSDTFRKKAL